MSMVVSGKDGEKTAEQVARERWRSKAAYSQEALLKMVNVLFDPLEVATLKDTNIVEEAHLLGLTRINSSREAHHWALVITKEAGKRPLRPNSKNPKDRKWSLSKIYRICFMLARRSLEMRAFMMGIGLAGKQTIEEEESEGEGYDL